MDDVWRQGVKILGIFGWVMAALFAGLWLGKQTEARVQYPDVTVPSVFPQITWHETKPWCEPSTVEPVRYPSTTWISTSWNSENVTPTQQET
jgi:hypothetical protein